MGGINQQFSEEGRVLVRHLVMFELCEVAGGESGSCKGKSRGVTGKDTVFKGVSGGGKCKKG